MDYGSGGATVPSLARSFHCWTTTTQPPLDDADQRTRILERLNAISGVQIPPVRNGGPSIEVRPNIQLQTLAETGKLDEFTRVFDDVVAELRGQ